MGIAYYVLYIINELSRVIQIGLMVGTVPINLLNFQTHLQAVFLLITGINYLKPNVKSSFWSNLYYIIRSEHLSFWVSCPKYLGESSNLFR